MSVPKTFGTIPAKKVPSNPRYAHVGATLKTGKHAGNVKTKVDRSGEPFHRIRPSVLVKLMQVREAKDESVYDLVLSDTASVTSSVIYENDISPDLKNTEFLVMDIRDSEDYEKCHIDGAISFPAVNLRRDHCPPLVYGFKNKDTKIIVIYGLDSQSKLGAETAVQFIQKDWQNVVLLTGELRGFAAKYPDRIMGQLPPAEKGEEKGKTLSATSASRLTTPQVMDFNSSRPGSTASHARTGSASSSSHTRTGSALSRPPTGAGWR